MTTPAERLAAAIHMESAAIAPHTSPLIEAAKEVLAENERYRAATERADYYINRLEAAHRGHVVRDLDEACSGWESYKARITQQLTPQKE